MSFNKLGSITQQFNVSQFGKTINGYRSFPMGNQNFVFANFEITIHLGLFDHEKGNNNRFMHRISTFSFIPIDSANIFHSLMIESTVNISYFYIVYILN